MKKKRILIISSIIFIIIVATLFVSYGYITASVSGNESSKKTAFSSQVLKIEYSDNEPTLESNQGVFTPGSKITKNFTIKNTGNVPVKFDIDLTNVNNKFTRKQDIVYSIKSGDDILIEGMFPTYDQTILNDVELEVNESKTFTLIIEYLNSEENQIVDSGTEPLKATISFSDANNNPYSKGTLPYYLYKNGALVHNITKNEFETYKSYVEKTQIRKISDGTDMADVGIFTAPDDYGTSYYYRGPVKNNYMDFAGFTWRIVRINGDGSVRLILDGTLDKICVEYNFDNTCKTYAGPTSGFNSSSKDNAYVGYMYGYTGGVENKCLTKDKDIGKYTIDSSETITTEESCISVGGRWAGTPYETTHINKNSSTIKTNIDTFYETYIENGTSKQYEKYLADTIFCGDKSLADSSIGSSNIATGYGTGTDNKTYYAATKRLYYRSGTSGITTANPTLKCAEGEINTYSRYTVEEQNRNNVNTNGDLKHPIALLSADELVLAGAFRSKANTNYYLHNIDTLIESKWWTMTPISFTGSSASEFDSYAITSTLSESSVSSGSGYTTVNGNKFHYYFTVRPVINLRADLLVESGDGTSDGGAYKVKLPN